MNVLHVPTITQNLVSIGQIVDQGMQVRFTHLGPFIEQEGRIIARGRREGRMFILDRTDNGPDTALFAKGQKAKSDIDLWHKRIDFKTFRRNKWFSVCPNLVATRHRFVKPASSGSNTDFRFPTIVIGAITRSI
jgi:hypothetical protein